MVFECSLKRLLRYLQHTKHYALTYSATQSETTTLVQGWTNPTSQQIGWSDSDWGGDVDDRESIGGYVYTLVGVVVNVKETKSEDERRYTSCGLKTSFSWRSH